MSYLQIWTEDKRKYIIFHRTERERDRYIEREEERTKEEQQKEIKEIATRSYKGRQINILI